MRHAPKPTIEDIARRAGVSISTVSRVLRQSSSVAADKRRAVLRAVDELDYRPNVFAQGLASGQSMTVGVLTQNFGSPFYDGILLGIMQGLARSDYSPIFVDGRWETLAEQAALQTLLDRRVDGLIVVAGHLPEATLRQVSRHTPLICVARPLDTIHNHCIYLDNFSAAYHAVRYLIDMGHRQIAHITAGMHYQHSALDISQRLEGYKQALRDAGLVFNPQLVVEGDLRHESGTTAATMLLAEKRPFSAIFAANDQMAFGARLALHRVGMRVPDEVSLLGFDDQDSAAFMVPPLTSVRQPAVEMGEAAATAVLNLIDGKPVSPLVLEGQLIIRESVARHP